MERISLLDKLLIGIETVNNNQEYINEGLHELSLGLARLERTTQNVEETIEEFRLELIGRINNIKSQLE